MWTQHGVERVQRFGKRHLLLVFSLVVASLVEAAGFDGMIVTGVHARQSVHGWEQVQDLLGDPVQSIQR